MTGTELAPYFRGLALTGKTSSFTPANCQLVTLPNDLGFDNLTVYECNRRLKLRGIQMSESLRKVLEELKGEWYHPVWSEKIRLALVRVDKGYAVSSTMLCGYREAHFRNFTRMTNSIAMHGLLTLPVHRFTQPTVILFAHPSIELLEHPFRRSIDLCLCLTITGRKSLVVCADALPYSQTVCTGGAVYVAFWGLDPPVEFPLGA